MTQINTGSIAVPAEDSAIGDALSQLESKLTAWCDAFGAAQQALLDESERLSNTALAVAAAPAEPPAPAEPESASEAAVSEAQPETIDEGAWPEPAPLAEPPTEPQADVDPEVVSDEPQDARLQEAATADSIPAPSSSSTDGDDEDEAVDELEQARLQNEQEERELLESLDPKIRMEIRIRRRLDSSKCVKELLEEVLASTPQSEDESKDRKWWKRGGKK